MGPCAASVTVEGYSFRTHDIRRCRLDGPRGGHNQGTASISEEGMSLLCSQYLICVSVNATILVPAAAGHTRLLIPLPQRRHLALELISNSDTGSWFALCEEGVFKTEWARLPSRNNSVICLRFCGWRECNMVWNFWSERYYSFLLHQLMSSVPRGICGSYDDEY